MKMEAFFSPVSVPNHLRACVVIMSYRIYSAIRRGFHLSRMTTNN